MGENLTDLDVIVIGGGPAGLSAALWCTKLGLRAVVLEKEAEFGGQLLWTFNAIKDHLGVEAADGHELLDRFLRQLENSNFPGSAGTPVAAADLAQKTVTLTDGRCIRSSAIIIATGVRRRALNVAGEERFTGRGILDSGVRCRNEVSGKIVAIIGGGDAAVENALILSQTALKVIVIHRRAEFTARQEFIDRLRICRNVECLMNRRVIAIAGNETLEGVEVEDLESGTRSLIDAGAVLIRIGVVPNTDMFASQIAMDPAGYITIDAGCRTNADYVFAAGDVASPNAPTISNAVGHGAAAAKFAARQLRAK